MSRHTCDIVGMSYHTGAKEKVAKLPDNTTVILRRDPQNEYDSNAVKVMTRDGFMLGYLPATKARTIAPEMDRQGFDELRAQFNAPCPTPSVTFDV